VFTSFRDFYKKINTTWLSLAELGLTSNWAAGLVSQAGFFWLVSIDLETTFEVTLLTEFRFSKSQIVADFWTVLEVMVFPTHGPSSCTCHIVPENYLTALPPLHLPYERFALPVLDHYDGTSAGAFIDGPVCVREWASYLLLLSCSSLGRCLPAQSWARRLCASLWRL